MLLYEDYLTPDSILDKTTIINNINEKGWSHAGCLKENYINEFKSYFDSCVWYNYHVKGPSCSPVKDRKSTPSSTACVSSQDVILAPHWFDISLKATDLVIDYFNTDDIELYSYNAFYSNPVGSDYEATQVWHNDTDKTGNPSNFIVLFMYLTDVFHKEDGSHAFEQKDGERIDIFGPAGTMFFADTRQLHKGRKPKFEPRGLAWILWSPDFSGAKKIRDITYGASSSPMDKKLLGSRYPEDERLKRIIKQMIN